MTQIVVLPHVELCPDGAVIEAAPGTSLCDALLENEIDWDSIQDRIDAMVIDEVKVRTLDDVAIVTGRTRATGSYQGKSVTATLRFTDVFAVRDGRWVVVASHASSVVPSESLMLVLKRLPAGSLRRPSSTCRRIARCSRSGMPKITYIGSVCVTVASSTFGPDTLKELRGSYDGTDGRTHVNRIAVERRSKRLGAGERCKKRHLGFGGQGQRDHTRGRADVAKEREHPLVNQLAGIGHAALRLVPIVQPLDFNVSPIDAALGIEGFKVELGTQIKLQAELFCRP